MNCASPSDVLAVFMVIGPVLAGLIWFLRWTDRESRDYRIKRATQHRAYLREVGGCPSCGHVFQLDVPEARDVWVNEDNFWVVTYTCLYCFHQWRRKWEFDYDQTPTH